MDKREIEEILSAEPDTDRARAKIEALMAAERFSIDRARSEQEQERLEREKRRWYANPLFVAVSVGVLTLWGDVVLSSIQAKRDRELQQEKAASDLIRSAFVDDPEQTIRNLEFMIAAKLIADDQGAILAAAKQFGPRESSTGVTNETDFSAGKFSTPQFVWATVVDVYDGNTIYARLDRELEGEPRPARTQSGQVIVKLSGIDAPETHIFECGTWKVGRELQIEKNTEWAEIARDFLAESIRWRPNAESRILLMPLEVNFLGQLKSLVFQESGNTKMEFHSSLNAELLRKGLAFPRYEDELPIGVIAEVFEAANSAFTSSAGAYEVLSSQVDLQTKEFDMVHPWLLYHACTLLWNQQDPNSYFENIFSRIEFVDIESGRPVVPVEIDQDRLMLRVPLHRIIMRERSDP